ncbi:MAG: DNA polymerase III subunit gamma/tau [bacterium]|nr:DNA polymerase III subunit gamma/tau [bacterium]
MATLYQKYRPKNFEEVVNQNHIKITLQNELETDDVSHAYLFAGPRGTGKTTLARVLAKAVNCQTRKQGSSEPCCVCESCTHIDTGASLDIIEIDAASHTGVDNVRDNIIASARVAVSPQKHKVFIIDEVHMLSISAFNALLKTLEEPPTRVIFILATTEVHKLPTTIISRCERFDFKRIAVADIVKKLDYIAQKEGIEVERSVLENVARRSGGHMRDAESLFGQIISISGKKITAEKAELVIPQSQMLSVVEFIEFLSNKDAAGAISLLNKLINEGIDLKNFTVDVIETLRKMMLLTVSPQLAVKFAADLGVTLEEKLQPLSNKIGTPQLIKIITTLLKAQQELKTAFIIQFPLEIAAITISGDLDSDSQKTPPRASMSNVVSKSYDSVKQASQSIPHTLSIGIDTIKAKWNEVLLSVKKNNHSLSFIMKVCDPRVINKQLCLVFKYKFHKERLDQPQIKSLVDKALQEVYKMPISFTTEVDESLSVSEEVREEADEKTDNAATQTKNEIKKEVVQEKKETPTSVEDEKVSPSNEADRGVKTVLEMFGGKVVG